MAKPRKKIPTGPTKDDLLSRLGSAFQRPSRRQRSTEAKTSETSSVDPQNPQAKSDPETSPADPAPEPDPLEIQQKLPDDEAKEQPQDHPEDHPQVSPEPIATASSPDPASDLDLPPSDPLSPEDVAAWLESAGSAEAADLMEAVEQIESEELGGGSPVTPLPSSGSPSGDTQVETMLDDLLSALQWDEEDEDPALSPPEDPIPGPDRSPHATAPPDPQPEPIPAPSEPKIPPTPKTLTLKLSPEATQRLHQIQAESGALPEILVDVIIRHWDELPDWAKQKHLGLAHQIRVDQILAGQQRTIQSIERLLAGDPGD